MMINIVSYINMVLDKKGISRADFAKKINEIEDKLGDTRTSSQNITNYLNKTDDEHNIGWKMALKMEKALDLPDDTLIKMVKSPIMPQTLKDFNELKKKVRKL